ncbi:MAG: hypothetical protein BRD49_01625, partial [Bacteroidetes bacterium SW_10_40_5]
SQITLPYSEGFESLSGTYLDGAIFCGANGANWYFNSSDPEGRLRFSGGSITPNNGSNAATLDRDPSGTFTANDWILELNMSNYAGNPDIYLSFAFRDYGEEQHPNDSVWVRGGDNDNWIGIYDLYANASSNYTNVGPVNISSILSNNGQSFSSTFQVRFGQEDNFPLNSDGFSFDDVTIQEAGCTTDPQNLTASNVTDTSGSINWTPGDTASNSWQIAYGTSGFALGNGTRTTVSSDSVNLTGLMDDTEYVVYVREICGSNDTTVFAGPISFMTDPSCFAPSNLTAFNLTTDSVDVSWTVGQSASTEWQIAYDTSGFALGNGTRIITSSNPYNLAGLNSDTEYDVYVREICGPSDTSSWVGPLTFSTTCPVPSQITLPYSEGFESLSGTYLDGAIFCGANGANW